MLVVEDNEFNMEVVRCMLENAGNLVTMATNGLEAVEAYTSAVELLAVGLVVGVAVEGDARDDGGRRGQRALRAAVHGREDGRLHAGRLPDEAEEDGGLAHAVGAGREDRAVLEEHAQRGT